jgi:signal transduction histidine kinase
MGVAGNWRHRSERRRRRSPGRPARVLGTPSFDIERWRGDLLATTYALGGIAVVVAWAVDPGLVESAAGLGVVLGIVFAAAAAMYLLGARLASWTGDVAIPGSLVLIDLGMFFTKLHHFPMLLAPFYVWVGFASPLWFSRRRATLYVALTFVASGLVVAVARTTASVAVWSVTLATLLAAFFITNYLTDILLRRERLAVVGEMASVVGHDLRNPLGTLSNTLFLLRHELGEGSTEEVERHLRTAEREIQKATNIVGHLSSFVRHARPDLLPVDAEALIAEILEVAPPPPGISVTVEVENASIVADKGQISEVLTNLVTNAYDAMGAAGSLHLRVHDDERATNVVVADDGPGIDPLLTERVFEPFFTTKQRGTGLGLAIVRRLVGAHGGTVLVERRSPKGTVFTIRLPKPSDTQISKSFREGRPSTGTESAEELQTTSRQ